MGTAETISLVASIGAMLSAIAAVISCFLHYRFTKPKIEIIIHQEPWNCFYFESEDLKGNPVNMGFMIVSIFNSSSVGGTIGGITLVYNHQRFPFETVGANYNPDWYYFERMGTLKQDPEFFRLKTPLTVPAYSGLMGYCLLPSFPIVNDSKIYVTIECKIIGSKLKIKRYKNVRFDREDRIAYNILKSNEQYLKYTPLLSNFKVSFEDKSVATHSADYSVKYEETIIEDNFPLSE